jgi:hypothetical protein
MHFEQLKSIDSGGVFRSKTALPPAQDGAASETPASVSTMFPELPDDAPLELLALSDVPPSLTVASELGRPMGPLPLNPSLTHARRVAETETELVQDKTRFT